MTHEKMKAIYDMARTVYEDKRCLKDCMATINKKYGISESTFRMASNAFRYMLDGHCDKICAMNLALRDYMLNRIYDDYGLEKYRVAVNAYKECLDYVETHNNISKIKERELCKKHIRIISNGK